MTMILFSPLPPITSRFLHAATDRRLCARHAQQIAGVLVSTRERADKYHAFFGIFDALLR